MANLFQRSKKVTDPMTGKSKVKKLPKWWGQYKDADGITRRVSLSSNKTAANQMLAELVKQAELGKAGLVNPFAVHLTKPIGDHLDGFRDSLRSKDNTPQHVDLTLARVRVICEGCGLRRLSDLDADKVSCWLKKQREAGRFGVSTSNHHLVAIKSFGNWLMKAERLPRNPFAHLARLNAKVDVRVQRRALQADEVIRLIATTESSQTLFRGLAGRDRAVLYLLAATSGFRVDELATLTPESFDLESDSPTVKIAAKDEKSRRGAVQPIPVQVARRLAEWIASRPDGSSTRLWPGTWREKAASMIRGDLKAARDQWIKEAEENPLERDGRVQSDFLKSKTADGTVDFHGLRHTFCTLMASSGVHPGVAQKLARHSTITLTMDRYSHVDREELTRAVATLPSLATPQNAFTATAIASNPVYLGVCLEDDFSCDPLMTIDESEGYQSEWPDDERLDEILESHVFYLITQAEEKMKALGLEPRTYGLKVRCSTD
jgi:site-specific recombinase XerD